MNRFYLHHKGLFFDWRRLSERWNNQYFNNEEWLIQREWFVLARLNPKWFELGDIYYDGHWMKSITVCGIEIGCGYGYDSRPVKDWTQDEIARRP